MSKKGTDPEKADTFDTASGTTAVKTREKTWRQGTSPSLSTDQLLRHPLLLLAVLVLLGVCLAGLLIGRAAERERGQMLAAIHGRADSLAWALEGSARFLDRGGPGNGALTRLVEEVARQPGVAWIAITDSAGRILADSNPELVGSLLYTPGELRSLAPGSLTQGRFSPDDPTIYEAWRFFAPARLRGVHKRHGAPLVPDATGEHCVFVALDVTGMEDRLEEYVLHLWLVAGLVLVAVLVIVALGVLFRRYRSSRRLLADVEALTTQVIRNYPAGLLVLDTTVKVRLCNDRARALLGMEPPEQTPPGQDVSATPVAQIAGTGVDWPALMAELDDGPQILERELELWRPEGTPLPVCLTATRLTDSDGETLGYLFALRDLGEIRTLQRRLRQHEHLSALGNLAAGLAHEIRNPLSSIRGYATYLTERLCGDPLGHATGQLLIEETERLNRVFADLLSLARPRDLAPAPVSLGAILSRVVAVATPDATEKGVHLRLSLPQGAADEAEVDADRLIQAVLNLVINAIQATEAGGEVEVALDRKGIPEDEEGAAPDPAGGGESGSWRIRVRDTGCGMSASTAAQIFTPYFSTKASGTGLGLSIARQIVEQHGGIISASSLPGCGTTMTILLPAADGDVNWGDRRRARHEGEVVYSGGR